MEIAVVGNCQAHPIALCLMAMAPDIVARPIVANRSTEITDDLTAYDLVFTTLLDDARLENAFPQLAGRVFQYPRVIYTAFAPDIVYATVGAEKIKSPVGDYHSSLILYAWLHSLSARETKALFCPEVFERLYFAGHQGLSRASMLREGEAIAFPVESLLDKWQGAGRFMHSVNHPRLFVLADIARVLAERSGIRMQTTRPEDYLVDPLMHNCVWPVYPGLNPQWEGFASYDFKVPWDLASADQPVKVLSLEGFIDASLEAYEHITKALVTCPHIENVAYQGLDDWARRAISTVSSKRGREKRNHPYVGLPPRQFWRSAVSDIPAELFDPVDDPPFLINADTKVATAGSCFAQHIALALRNAGLNYFVAEPPPSDLSLEEATDRQYGSSPLDTGTSTRRDNSFSYMIVLSALSSLTIAHGYALMADMSIRSDQQWNPAAFQLQRLSSGRATLISSAVRRLFEQLDVLVMTLGLTEAWSSKSDGAVVPLAPGVVADPSDPQRYEFVNFSVAEVANDLHEFRAKLKAVNPRARIILTVSPVPLAATFEHRHVLTATTYSKAVLRVAAEQAAQGRDDVMYFPSYEIVTGNYGHASHFEDDMRTVRQSSVDRVMDLFLRHFTDRSDVAARIESIQRILCDEELLAHNWKERWALFVRNTAAVFPSLRLRVTRILNG